MRLFLKQTSACVSELECASRLFLKMILMGGNVSLALDVWMHDV